MQKLSPTRGRQAPALWTRSGKVGLRRRACRKSQHREGSFAYGGSRYKLVDLPGAYSLLAASPDEETARNFLLFGKPDATVVVVDATRLERNLNLVLQILEIADRVVVCVNLIDEAERQGLRIDARQLARDLGVPVVLTAARSGRGLEELLQAIEGVAGGKTVCRPKRALPWAPLCRSFGRSIPSCPTRHGWPCGFWTGTIA